MGVLLHQVLDAKLLQTGFTFGRSRVDLTLHDVVLVVDMLQPARRLNEDEAVHAISDVLSDHRAAAVVDKQCH